jgi:hypothetical protein
MDDFSPPRPCDEALLPADESRSNILSLYYPLAVLPGGDFEIAAPRTPEQAQNLALFVAAAQRIATLGRDLLREWEAAHGEEAPRP